MPRLDATLGGATANSYGRVEEADAYFANKFRGVRWRSLGSETKILGLLEATEVLDGLRYWGVPAVPGQRLAFPRIYEPASDGASIPGQILAATYLLALDLAEREAQEAAGGQCAKISEMRAAGVSRFKLAEYEVAFHGGGEGTAVERLPAAVQDLIGAWVAKGSRLVGRRCRSSLYPSSLPWACR